LFPAWKILLQAGNTGLQTPHQEEEIHFIV